MKKFLTPALQIIFLFSFYIIGYYSIYPLPLGEYSNAFFRFDVLLFVTNFFSTLSFKIIFLPAIFILILTFFTNRFFCKFICPLGNLYDSVNFILLRKKWPRKISSKITIKNIFAIQISLTILAIIFSIFNINSLIQFIDPLVISYRPFYSKAGVVLLFALILLNLFSPRFWCYSVCPLGGILEVVNRCGRKIRHQNSNVTFSSRRNLFSAIGISAVSSVIIKKTETLIGENYFSNILNSNSRFLRPPASLNGNDFHKSCIRCGACMRTCPTNGLFPSTLEEGVSGIGTPMLIPRKGPCELCGQCSKICPTNAITKMKEGQFKIGTAIINHEKCVAWKFNKLCLACMEVCPVLAINKDSQMRPSVIENKCIGCGQCEKTCPTGDKHTAIIVTRKGELRA